MLLSFVTLLFLHELSVFLNRFTKLFYRSAVLPNEKKFFTRKFIGNLLATAVTIALKLMQMKCSQEIVEAPLAAQACPVFMESVTDVGE